MRGPVIVLIALLSGTAALPDPAQAQLSPEGVFNSMTRPLRQMLGRFGHYPRSHRQNRRSAARGQADESATDLRLGLVGPAAWPAAYEAVIGYTFWPDEYAGALRGHGFDVIADTVTGKIEPMPRPARTATTGAAQNVADRGGCSDAPEAQEDWPAVRVGQTVQLTDTQRGELDKLQADVTKASKTINPDCRDTGDLPPPERLQALVQTLWTARDAGVFVREPLKDFYDTLTAAQKTSFTVPQTADSPQPDPRAAAGNQSAAGSQNKQFQACAAQNAAAAERMIKTIEQKVRPNKEQAASLENLHKVSGDMAKLMMASCAKPVPATPMARLDAANDELTAMNYAATTVQIAFNDFYSRLDDTQKARFDAGR